MTNPDIHLAYCSAGDRTIRVAPRPNLRTTPRRGEDLVCLEYGDRCTGAMCPVFGRPTPEMAQRLRQALGGKLDRVAILSHS